MLTATLSGVPQVSARLEALPAVVIAALAAKSAVLAKQLTVQGPSVAGDQVATVIGSATDKRAVVRTFGAGAGAHYVAHGRDKSLALLGPPDLAVLLASRPGQIESELRAAVIAAVRGQMGA